MFYSFCFICVFDRINSKKQYSFFSCFSIGGNVSCSRRQAVGNDLFL